MRAGTNLIGLRGYFQAQYGPLTVSFTNAQLRENPPLQIINFPSGKDPFVVHQGPYTPVPPSDSDFYDNPLLNAALDMIGLFPPNPITDLLDKNTQVMTPFSATITVPLQYQDANGNWQTFYSHTTSINISTSGVTTISVGAPGPVKSSPPTNSGPWTNYGH